MKNLQHDRPIAFLDLETTGVNPSQDRIVELTVLKILPDGSEQLKSERINPMMPIPPGQQPCMGLPTMMWRQHPCSANTPTAFSNFLTVAILEDSESRTSTFPSWKLNVDEWERYFPEKGAVSWMP